MHRLLGHADAVRRLGVRANADTGADARRARRFGATGIGLCRTAHMFLGERRVLVERLILADGPGEVTDALDVLLPLQRADFVEILTAMDGLLVTIRLIDPPLHEFLPPLHELTARVARAEVRGEASSSGDHRSGGSFVREVVGDLTPSVTFEAATYPPPLTGTSFLTPGDARHGDACQPAQRLTPR